MASWSAPKAPRAARGPSARRRTRLRRRDLALGVVLVVAVALVGTAVARATPSTAVPATFPAAGTLVSTSVAARAQADPHARRILLLHQFRSDFRRQVVFAIGGKVGTDGRPWYHVRLAMRPNGTTGWIPAASVSLAPTPDAIVVSRGLRRLDIFHRARLVLRTRVAVGAPGRETPLGRFYVAARFTPRDSFLGVFAVETSAYSRLTDWPGGGLVGIHGTSAPELLGRAVSHGCVRVSNTAALVLKRYAPLGTPITIVP